MVTVFWNMLTGHQLANHLESATDQLPAGHSNQSVQEVRIVFGKLITCLDQLMMSLDSYHVSKHSYRLKMDFPIGVSMDPSCQSTAFKISDNQSVSKISETKAVCEEHETRVLIKRVQTAEWGHKNDMFSMRQKTAGSLQYCMSCIFLFFSVRII